MVDTFLKGFDLPLMKPVPLPIPEPVAWWNIWGKIKNLFQRAQPRRWEIMEDYSFYVPWLNTTIWIPKGFIFDGASIPRLLWPFMAPTGVMFIAGLFHDFGYRYNSWADENNEPIYHGAGKEFFDDQIERMGTYINDITVIPNVCWFGLVIGGWKTWNTRRKENAQVQEDFPSKIIKE